MVFSSLEFLLIFLPIFLIVYYLIPVRFRNLCLLIFSLGFYVYGTWGQPEQVGLLLASVCLNYAIGLGLEKHNSKILLTAGLVFNFGILFLFKYSGFFLSFVSDSFSKLALPVGISFYTFQAAAYLIDIYRKTTPAEHNIVCFGTYLVMFPKLVSGPIARYSELRKALHRRKHKKELFFRGLQLLILGLGLKVLLANRIGNLWRVINGIGFASISTPLAWMGLLACSLQIYFDFWGYSLMAVGLGNMIGFHLPVNFRHPYQARSMTEFWRRWHITLGAWFRDYVYIPLGGNRCGKGKTYRNLLIVWVLTGVWHGAGWNFLLWGLLLFTIIALEKSGMLSVLDKKPLLSHLYMILLIPLSWLLFSVTDMHSLGVYLLRLIGLGGDAVFQGDFLKYAAQYGELLAVGVLMCTPIPYRVWDRVKKPWAIAVVLAVILFSCVYYLFQGSNDPFLYFSF